MADEIDAQQVRDEVRAPYLLAASKRPIGPVATGKCHLCDHNLPGERRFCDAECRDLFEVHESRRRANGKKS